MRSLRSRGRGKLSGLMRFLKGALIGMAGGVAAGLLALPAGEVQAAGSYTNAREFYETVNNRKHTEIYNGDIYYASVGKLASPGSGLRYYTVGQDLTITGNGTSLGISVKRDGTMKEVSSVRSGGYEYVLYRISCQDLINLANARNRAVADSIFQAELVEITIDNIITTKSGSTLNGGVSESGNGILQEWGTIYHLGDSSSLRAARRIFSGHDFLTYIDIKKDIDNFTMTIRYDTAGGRVSDGFQTVKNSLGEDILCRNGQPVETKVRLLQQETMVIPDNISLSSSPRMTKEGYHLIPQKEWCWENRFFNAYTAYLPKEIHPLAGTGNIRLTMHAGWQPNTYTIRYDANGGQGLMADQLCTYDVDTGLRAMAYSREGYTFREWNTLADGSGTGYGREYENISERPVRNLTETDGAVVLLYAIWEPNLYQVQAVKDGGTGIYQGSNEILGGTDLFYEKYEQAWCSDSQGKNEIGRIEIPRLYGYEFSGYYTGISGMGALVVDEKGAFAMNRQGTLLDQKVADKNIFLCDSLVYASWQPRRCQITFEKQGGYGGSDAVAAVFGEAMPYADGPVRDGWEFQGYYTQPEGKGICYYNENMAGLTLWDREEDTTLYAFWKDTTAPRVTLTASAGIWTNRTITLTARAWDLGVGLERIEIYQGSSMAAEQADLNGAAESFLSCDNPKEGALRYKAVAYDRNGLKAEAWCSVYYDVTAPRVSDRNWLFDGYVVSDSLFVTDYVSIRER